MHKPELFFHVSAIVLAIGLSLTGVYEGYPHEAMLFPVMVTVLLVTFAVARVIEVRRNPANATGATDEDSEEAVNEGVTGNGSLIGPFAWIASIVVVLPLLGYQIGLPLYVFAFLLTHRVAAWLSLVIAVGTAAFIYLVFVRLLHVLLPSGLLGGLFY